MISIKYFSFAHRVLLGLDFDNTFLVDDTPVLLCGQNSPAENGVWFAHEGSWTREPTRVRLALICERCRTRTSVALGDVVWCAVDGLPPNKVAYTAELAAEFVLPLCDACVSELGAA